MSFPNADVCLVRKKLLILCDSYLPSYTSGGGMWTVVNLVKHFSDQYEMFVFTRNYDLKGDGRPYENIKPDAWVDRDDARVFYCSGRNLKLRTIISLVREIGPDAILLNSAMSTPTIKLLTARRKGMIGDIPVILAPCGEFSEGCLSIKPYKKKAFLAYARMVDLYRGVIWKASFEAERSEIIDVIGGNSLEIWIAPDLTPREILPRFRQQDKPVKSPGSAKFVSLSRILRIKNIGFFLERLGEIRDGTVEFDIIGPVEDQAYWNDCQRLIEKLPSNISVSFAGAMPWESAMERLVESHFFVLPTLNENFGYVFVEALSAGCPVMTSDRTSWSDLPVEGAGWTIPLDDHVRWQKTIRDCLAMDDQDYVKMSSAARAYALSWLAEPSVKDATSEILQRALGGKQRPVSSER
jgi:glycosyltransferase involved in cell wall biosynthesis